MKKVFLTICLILISVVLFADMYWEKIWFANVQDVPSDVYYIDMDIYTLVRDRELGTSFVEITFINRETKQTECVSIQTEGIGDSWTLAESIKRQFIQNKNLKIFDVLVLFETTHTLEYTRQERGNKLIHEYNYFLL